jgi:hypothetical protein
MMKPWQTRLNKAPGHGGKEKKRMNKEREDPSPNQKRRNPMWVTMGYPISFDSTRSKFTQLHGIPCNGRVKKKYAC